MIAEIIQSRLPLASKEKKAKQLKSFFQPLISLFKKTNPKIGEQLLEKELDFSAGIEFHWENPDQLLEDLRRNEKLYDIMMLDDRIAFAINMKKRMVLSVPADIIPASEEEKDVEIANEIRDQLKINGESKYIHSPAYNFWSMLDNAMDATAYGHKVCEKIFSIQDNKVVFTHARFKHSMFFRYGYDEYGNLDKLSIGKDFGFEQIIEPAKKIEDKFILWTYPYIKDGNYYGDSELNKIYTQYRAKQHIFKQRNIHLEKWGTPVPEIIFDSKRTSVAEKNAIDDMLENWQEGTFFKNPGRYDENRGELVPKLQLNLHEVKNGTATDQFEKAIDQIDKQITRAVLFPDKLGFSESPGGSYNQSETQMDILLIVIEYMHQWIEGYVNQLVKQLVDINFQGVTEYPKFKFDKISDKIQHEMLQTLINLGVVDKRESWIRSRVGIPTLTQEEQDEIEKQREEDEEKQLDRIKKESEINGNNGNDVDGKKKPMPNKPNEKKPGESDSKMQRFAIKKNPFDAKGVKKFLEVQEDEFSLQFTGIMQDNIEALIKQIEKKKIIQDKNLSAKESLRMPKRELNKFLTQKFAQMYLTGKVNAVEEIKGRMPEKKSFKNDDIVGMTSINGMNSHSHQYILDNTGTGQTTTTNGEAKPHVHAVVNFVVEPRDHEHTLNLEFKSINMQDDPIDFLDKKFIDRFLEKVGVLGTLTSKDREALKFIKNRAFTVTGLEEDKLIKQAYTVIDEGIRTGASVADVSTQLRAISNGLLDKNALTIARTNIVDHYNTGRMNLFTSPGIQPMIEAYEYQAIMDDATTAFCSNHDGQILMSNDPRLAQVNPPNHFNCRSILVPIMLGEGDEPGYFKDYKDNKDPFGANVPKNAVNPDPGFGGPAK